GGLATILTQVRFEWLQQPPLSLEAHRVFSGSRRGIAVRIRRPSSRNARAAARFVLQLARQGIIRPGAGPIPRHPVQALSWQVERKNGLLIKVMVLAQTLG
ncbi:MAG: hypothetical protein ACXU9C_09180, partial [Xanthobacteraceae bacterium]